MALASMYGVFSRDQRLILATGFAGGLTTFSTFMYEKLLAPKRVSATLHAYLRDCEYLLGLLGYISGFILANLACGCAAMAMP